MTALNLNGRLTRLAPVDPELFARAIAGWTEDSEYDRLLDAEPVGLFHAADLRKTLESLNPTEHILLGIYPLAEDRLVGFIELDGFDRPAQSAWAAIGIGERAYRGKGLGSDAMDVMARFAFQELNLNRINLNVFEFNTAAIRCYERVGFVHEGRLRQCLLRGGQRWDMIYMGLLRSDWQARAA